MKTVDTLDKKKYRRDLWLDTSGILWYWDNTDDDWVTLEPAQLSTWDNINQGYEVTTTLTTEDADDWPDGPFRRVAKGPRD